MTVRRVIVVGGGIWGLACAYACARRGMSVRLFDADRVGSGASGGIVGALAPHTPDQWNPKKQFQFEALSSAGAYWTEVDALSGVSSGYGRIGRVVPLTSERERGLAEARIETARRFWQGRFDWRVEDGHPLIAARAAPFGVVFDTLSARLFPARAVTSLAGACRKLGVEIAEERRVTGLRDHRVSGAWGVAEAEAVVLAGGTGAFSLLSEHLGCRVGSGVKGQAALLDADLGAAPQIYGDGVYLIPHQGGSVAVGSTSEETWTDATAVDEKLDRVIEKARFVCPSLRGAKVVQRWAGLRPKARKRDPMLGPVPGLAGVFAALGGFKIGFGLAHKVGEVLADYAEGRTVELPTSFTVEHHIN